ncbi:MAG: RlmE family RNA methyltransferase [Gammaproteobacteria bacterium]|jgi:23S rRNA (uridine2552-2'-O)-methyltransferase|nr:RlmE family RNA methyltransferase [Gammaproteobacteria bacterium]
MPRSKSSRRWLDRQAADPYVQRARERGYRSRAAFKLLELDERDHFLRAGQRVVDLGAAPGGWSQVARQAVGPTGRVYALDLLPIDPIPGVEVLVGDFQSDEIAAALSERLGGAGIDVVMSDMAPNVSGVDVVDQARSMNLAELALAFAQEHLIKGGVFVVKVFQGDGSDAFVKAVRRHFGRVAVRKPKASRPESRETYLVARDFVV